MKIKSKRHTETTVEYTRFFERAACPGAGFAFSCAPDGRIHEHELHPAGRESLRRCLSGEVDVVDRGVQHHEHRYTHPAVGVCDACGCDVWLGHFTNTCECGADYNMSGHRLASREQWGEETGEHWTDCY